MIKDLGYDPNLAKHNNENFSAQIRKIKIDNFEISNLSGHEIGKKLEKAQTKIIIELQEYLNMKTKKRTELVRQL